MNERERDERFTLIRICGCVACHLAAVPGVVGPQIHHLNFGDKHGGKRLGDDHTIGLCIWHHVGQPHDGMWPGRCRALMGPSWAREPSAFRETFGTGAALLEFQNELIAGYLQRTSIPAADRENG